MCLFVCLFHTPITRFSTILATDGQNVDDAIVALSKACVAFVSCVRDERRLLVDDEAREKLGESVLVVSKATKGGFFFVENSCFVRFLHFFCCDLGLAMAAAAIGRVDTAQSKMEGILAILQKQLEKIQLQFNKHAPLLK